MKKIFLFPAVLLSFSIAAQELPMRQGIFEPTVESLSTYQFPEWFRDAKFGIWSHWGPQAVPREGDWYAKNMYIYHEERTGNPNRQYSTHVERYGNPADFGYKDIIPLWKAERWNPEELMKLFKKAGAKYFVSMATHHDNFFLWNSKLHRWNSVNMGPRRDVVGEWQKAAKRNGLYFGVSEHLAASYTWFQTAHGTDPNGKQYDGNDPQYQDLYHKKAAPDDNKWLTNNPEWQRQWYDRITELIDGYHPDLLYSDSRLPFGNFGHTMLAHYYNQGTNKKGITEVVYTAKQNANGMFAHDIELGVREDIGAYPWQTDTSIGDWYYRTGQGYRSSDQVIQMLVDVVSKNGNMLLNVVQTPEGDLEPDVLKILEGIAVWIKDNGEAIYGSRPWSVFGEGPSLQGEQEQGRFGGLRDVRKYQPGDLRFTTKKGVLYAFAMEHPQEAIKIASVTGKKVKSVSMLGSKEKIKWSQQDGILLIEKPAKLPEYNTLVFKIEFGS